MYHGILQSALKLKTVSSMNWRTVQIVEITNDAKMILDLYHVPSLRSLRSPAICDDEIFLFLMNVVVISITVHIYC